MARTLRILVTEGDKFPGNGPSSCSRGSDSVVERPPISGRDGRGRKAAASDNRRRPPAPSIGLLIGDRSCAPELVIQPKFAGSHREARKILRFSCS